MTSLHHSGRLPVAEREPVAEKEIPACAGMTHVVRSERGFVARIKLTERKGQIKGAKFKC